MSILKKPDSYILLMIMCSSKKLTVLGDFYFASTSSHCFTICIFFI